MPETDSETKDLQKYTTADAKAILTENDRGSHTIPSRGIYPHQWLWDSCFIAIGQRHYDVDRAQTEILSLLTGQWSNGMVPHVIFDGSKEYRRERDMWRSKVSPFAPENIETSGMTQPPMIAEAVVRIGEALDLSERRTWYKMVYPALLAYHQWLYRERDPHQEGLVLQIHPWETGLDTTPPWMSMLHEHLMPFWIRAVEKVHLDFVMRWFRRDTKIVPIEQRYSNIEALAFYDAQRRLKRKSYSIDKILDHSLFAIEDLTFNCIFIRANHLLRQIAKTIREDLPEDLAQNMTKTEKALDHLWDEYAAEYYSRDFVTHKLIKVPTMATLMPLYAGVVSAERADHLVRMIENRHIFGTNYPIPTVPVNSAWFKEMGYWQGPVWININWLIIDGLNRYGYKDHAEKIRQKTIEMVSLGGFYEYFDPLNGAPLGTNGFSWTAALFIDLAMKDVKPHKTVRPPK